MSKLAYVDGELVADHVHIGALNMSSDVMVDQIWTSMETFRHKVTQSQSFYVLEKSLLKNRLVCIDSHRAFHKIHTYPICIVTHLS
jgi:hypothetical protein